MRFLKLFFIFVFVCLVVLPALVSAWSIGDPIVPCGRCLEVDDYHGGCANYDKCDLCDIAVLADNVISFLLFVLIMPAAVIAFIISGILMITAGGDPAKINKGKSIFTQVFFGMLLAFGAWLMVDTILGNFLDPGYLPVWNEFPSDTCRLFE